LGHSLKGCAVDPTIVPAISAIASRQAQGTEAMANACHQLLDYITTHPNAGIRYLASDMILAVHINALYFSKHNVCSWPSAHFCLTNKGDEEFNNGAILNLTSIIKHVMALASEAELAALYYGCKLAVPIQTTLDKMGHTTSDTSHNIQHYGTRSHHWHHDPKGFQINGSMIPLVEMPQCAMKVPILIKPRSPQLHWLHQ
jgi:hypothetical protein